MIFKYPSNFSKTLSKILQYISEGEHTWKNTLYSRVLFGLIAVLVVVLFAGEAAGPGKDKKTPPASTPAHTQAKDNANETASTKTGKPSSGTTGVRGTTIKLEAEDVQLTGLDTAS